jgi:hypothetical protein
MREKVGGREVSRIAKGSKNRKGEENRKGKGRRVGRGKEAVGRGSRKAEW